MKTFVQWAGETKKELPVYKQDESTKRSGLAYWAYPTAYNQRNIGYPDAYFMPSAADAGIKMSKKPNDKAPKDSAL